MPRPARARSVARNAAPAADGPDGPLLFTGLATMAAGMNARGNLPGWVISYTLEGGCDYRLNDTRLVLQKHDALLLRSHVEQAWRVPDAAPGSDPIWRVVYAAFHPPESWGSWLELLTGGADHARINLGDDVPTRRQLHRALRHAHQVATGTRPARQELAMQLIGGALLWLCGSRPRTPARDPRIARAVDAIARRLEQPLALDDLCDAASLSRSQLSLLFQETFGVPPMKYVECQRIERAALMLRMTTHPIKQIAHAVGFEDVRHFIKRFRARHGTTPRRFRDARA